MKGKTRAAQGDPSNFRRQSEKTVCFLGGQTVQDVPDMQTGGPSYEQLLARSTILELRASIGRMTRTEADEAPQSLTALLKKTGHATLSFHHLECHL